METIKKEIQTFELLLDEFNKSFFKLKEAFNKQILENAVKTNAKEFAVKASGHGSAFRFDGSDPDSQTLPPVTLKEAVNECDEWVGIADTIGGRACIYHIPTKTIVDYRQYL